MMEIRKVQQADIGRIAEIHLDAFQGFFLTSLGKGFLKSYYLCGLKSKDTIFLCLPCDDEQIAGFCFGTLLSKGFHKRLIIGNIFTFALIGIKVLFGRPKAILRLLFNLEKKVSNNDEGNYAELLSIAVSRNVAQKGLGKALLNAFEKELKKHKCERVALTTDFYDNDSVVSFYQNSGYVLFSEFFAFPKRKMLKFIKHLG